MLFNYMNVAILLIHSYWDGKKIMSNDEVCEAEGLPVVHTGHGDCTEHLYDIIR